VGTEPLCPAGIFLVALVFYLTLSVRMASTMLPLVGAMGWSFTLFSRKMLVIFYLVVFVLAWVGQFIERIIEGKKPSFNALITGHFSALSC